MTTGQYPKRRETDAQMAIRVARIEARREAQGQPVAAAPSALTPRLHAVRESVIFGSRRRKPK